MISTNTVYLPAYTTRDVRNFGYYKAGSFYKYLFTRQDNMLLASGAIKLMPFSMCDLVSKCDTVLNGKAVKVGDILDYNKFDDSVLKLLIKTNVIECNLKEDLAKKEINFLIGKSELYNCIGKTFKEASELMNIDFDIVKDKMGLKQGSANKKVKEEDIVKLDEVLAGV